MVYDFTNQIKKRLRDILRGSGSYTTYLNHPDTPTPAITSWVVQGRPEEIPAGSIMVTVTSPEPTEYSDSNLNGTMFEVGSDLQIDLYVSGTSKTNSPRSDLIRRNLVDQINRTLLYAKVNKYFSDLYVKDVSIRVLDSDDPDVITDRHTVYLLTFEGEGEI